MAGVVGERRLRQRQRQVEEGRASNQVYINAAARLVEMRPVPEQVAQQEEPRRGDGISEDAEAQPSATGVERGGLSPSDHNEGMPPSGSVVEPEVAEKPPATSGSDISSTISPPPPAHIGHSS